ncbi:hypothetical protein CGCVW01_v007650 [Colletotrichum viniferum]|nr:hypothetical protein CGCVW01_v007650 [Colletotrichum viniferum]
MRTAVTLPSFTPNITQKNARPLAVFCQVPATARAIAESTWITTAKTAIAPAFVKFSEERPFPHSECHYTIQCGMTESESTSWSYRWCGTGKVQYEKALNIGITGSYSWGESKAMGHSWSINLKPDQCGYFNFIPVRKITFEEGAEHIGNYCADQM